MAKARASQDVEARLVGHLIPSRSGPFPHPNCQGKMLSDVVECVSMCECAISVSPSCIVWIKSATITSGQVISLPYNGASAMEFASLVAKAMSWKWMYLNGEPLEWPGNQRFAISWNICISWASTGIWWNHRKTILLTGRPLRHHLMGLKGLTAPFNWPQVLLSFKPSAFAHLSQHIGKAGPAQVGKCHWSAQLETIKLREERQHVSAETQTTTSSHHDMIE